MLALVRLPLAAAFAAAAMTLLGPALARAETSFPQEIRDPKGTLTIYQPQPEKLAGNLLSSRAAVSFQRAGPSQPIFGAIWFTSTIDSREDGLTLLRDLRVTKCHWPDSTDEQEAKVTALVEAAAARSSLSVSTERLSASLKTAEREQRSLAELKNDPPKIVFANQLAVLLAYDGAPKWGDVEKSTYERAVNTPFLVMRDKPSQTCYLSSGALWYSAKDPLGPWQSLASPPADLVQMLPKDASQPQAPVPAKPPAIVVSTVPTELVVSDGEPKWKPVGDGALLFVENTETPWVRELATQQIYLLLSGRWFRAATTAGPWTFVRADKLPPSFKQIPPASDIGGVRVSVAGTEEAEDAVLDAAIPKTAAIKRADAKLEVMYDGEPKFQKIPGTSVSEAVNTTTQVLQIASKYYAVDNGVWFVASSPKGPWVVADSIPEEEIQKIPPSSPSYNTTYVQVYQSTPEYVYVGYTPGYVWSYPYYGVPVYGTGWYYPPYASYYYPRPVTYGLHVGYNPWTGWNVGMSVSYGFLTVGFGFSGGYPPYRAAYHHHGCCGGHYGGYPPRNNYYRGGNNVNVNNFNIGNTVNYGNRQQAANTLRTNSSSSNLRQSSVYNRQQVQNRSAEGAYRGGPRAQPARGPNNVVADRNGNVARQTPNGLETRSGNKWASPDRASSGSAPRAQSNFDGRGVQNDFHARERGAQREMQRPSYSPSRGGGMRGGGGRR
jgi:hypothetical protein